MVAPRALTTTSCNSVSLKANYESERRRLNGEISNLKETLVQLREGYTEQRERLDAEAKDHMPMSAAVFS